MLPTMSVNQGFSNIKSIKIVSIHEFYFVLDSKNWQLYNGYGDFLLVGSLDFGNRYVVIKYLGKEIILLPRNRLWTARCCFSSNWDCFKRFHSLFYINELLRCLRLVSTNICTYFANDCAVVDEGFLHVSIFDNV